MRKKLVAGNWKMNGARAESAALAASVAAAVPAEGVEVAVFPPFALLDTVAAAIAGSTVGLGGQDVSEHASGAFTGEVSASMLLDAGCRYAIVGHSERRAMFGDDSARVAAKFVAAHGAGLVPILCVGETLEDREGGRTEAVVGAQLDAVLDAAGVSAFGAAVLAYEPVWAIGTGRTATPEQAQAVHAFLRARVAEHSAEVADGLRILYGGSVKAANAAELFACADIDGGLIGGAALVADEFVSICMAGSA